MLSHPLVAVDAWLLAGAVAQCVLVLAARRFRLQDWLLPLAALIGISAGFFDFIRIASQDIGPAADIFILGFGIALILSCLYVAEFAPARLSASALLSLSITFWAAYLAGGLWRGWAVPAFVMSVAVVLFARACWIGSLPVRMLLQAWSLLAAAVLAADGVSARVAFVLMSSDQEKPLLAASLAPLEVLAAGAQFFLLTQMAAGLLLLFDADTWSGWLPSGDDERPGWLAIAALAVQGAAFAWLARSGALRGDLITLATLAALAYGAMTGASASGPGSPPNVDSDYEFRLSPEERRLFADAAAAARSFIVRRRRLLGALLALAALALIVRARL